MQRSVRIYRSQDEMKADEYRYWQSRPAHERMDAVEEIIRATYQMKGLEDADVSRLQAPPVCLQRPRR
jgi:hypothetical protein